MSIIENRKSVEVLFMIFLEVRAVFQKQLQLNAVDSGPSYVSFTH